MQTRSLTCHGPAGPHRMDLLLWGEPNQQPPLICVHGLVRNAWDFAPLAEALQQQRWIIAPHMAGRGSSAWLDDPQHYAYPQYIADMLELIQDLGVTQVDWLGTSMGGLIGMMLAAMPNTPIRRLLLNDVGPFIPFAALQRISGYVGVQPKFLTLGEVERHLRGIYASFGNLTDNQWKFMTEHSARPLNDGSFGLAYDPAIAHNLATVTSDISLWEIYDQIQVPTLVLRGERSDILRPETAEEMTQRGPKAQLITIPNCGHAPALMDDGQIEIVRRFFSA